MKGETQQWITVAQADYGVAQHLIEHYSSCPVEIICYHCQQCAEKAIKAMIIEKTINIRLPKVHDLSFLLTELSNAIEVDEKYYDYADVLNVYATQVRYHNSLDLEQHHAKQALKYSDEILAWTLSKINS